VTAVGLLLVGFGVILLWTGVRGDDLRQLFADVLGGSKGGK